MISIKCEGIEVQLKGDRFEDVETCRENVKAMKKFGLTHENAKGILSCIRNGDHRFLREGGFELSII